LALSRSDIGENAPKYITGTMHRKKIIKNISDAEKILVTFFDISFLINEKIKTIIGIINK
jgi:hypothetical protein